SMGGCSSSWTVSISQLARLATAWAPFRTDAAFVPTSATLAIFLGFSRESITRTCPAIHGTLDCTPGQHADYEPLGRSSYRNRSSGICSRTEPLPIPLSESIPRHERDDPRS